MKRLVSILCATALVATSSAQGQQDPGPRFGRLWISATEICHGRCDDVRWRGILTPENRRGQPIPGISTANPWVAVRGQATADPNVQPPAAQPPVALSGLLDAIASQPNPFWIDPTDPEIAAAAAAIPAGFVLLVAAPPQGLAPTPVFWLPLSPRFGRGNYYATVPSGPVARGQEIVTYEQYEVYAANSVLMEVPDVGLIVLDSMLDGGRTASAGANTTPVRVLQPGTFPAWGGNAVGYASAQLIDIALVGQETTERGTVRVTVQANSTPGFGPVTDKWYRWAVETNSGTRIVQLFATNTWTVELPLRPRANADTMVTFSVVGSPGLPGGGPPFLFPIPGEPQHVGLDFPKSARFTLSDTATFQIKPPSGIGVAPGDPPPGGPAPPGGGPGTSLVILLDASGSMRQNDRMAKAKAAASDKLQRLGPDTEVALIVFYDCGTISVEHGFTRNASEIIPILQRVKPSGGTPLAAGTSFAKEYLRKHAKGRSKKLIILTDGKETCGGDPVAAARR